MRTVKVHIPGKAVHGILRVIEAQRKYLPEFGVELTDDIDEADVINTHGADRVPVEVTKPILNTNHGLYWSRYNWGENYQEVNAMVVDAMVQAKAHTAPSQWVADSIRRGGLFYPEVIYHGIDADLWKPGENQKYILWNKARADYVSNPADMNTLAAMMLDFDFVSTIGRSAPNVRILTQNTTGHGVPFEEMKKHIADAGLYLTTARETFGIGTLEAMACGVPIVGWDWGGQSEIVIQGETGYLAKPGDYNQLSEMVKLAYAERERLSANCIEDVRERWQWKPRIEQYARMYKRLHTFYNIKSGPRVTVIVTAYNLDHYLPKCLDSVKGQSFEDFECLVIDDALLDSTKEIVERYAQEDSRFKYLRPEHNLGLPGARNFGFHNSKGMLIRHLDADDWLHQDALRKEVAGMDADNSIWIGYGPMMNVDKDGHAVYDGDGKEQVWAHHEFSWRYQMAHINQIPSCCMARRDVFDRAGGYRTRMHKAEDAHFWCLTTSNGFRPKKITNDITMYHRVHPDSKGAKEWEQDKTDGDWTLWFPYRFGAGTYADGMNMLARLGDQVPHAELVPFSASAPPPTGKRCWDVHDYSYPVVSIVVTVGPGYEKYIQDCLDSVAAQNYPDWECIVVNDTGREWPSAYWDSPLSGFPWAKVVSTGGNFGVSRARNVGAQQAKGSLLAPLDVDDFWLPWFLEKMVASYEANQGIIYSDVMFHITGEALKPSPFKEFACSKLMETGMYPGSSILIPKYVHDTVVKEQGGWDEEIPGMEDWDYQIACHAYSGVCAYRVEEPLFIYRYRPDGNREKHAKLTDQIVQYIDKKWKVYRTGEKQMGCGCKSKTKKAMPSSALSSTGASVPVAATGSMESQTVDLIYLGDNVKINYRGKATGTIYRFGSLPAYKVKRVYVEDAKELLHLQKYGGLPLFQIHEQRQPVTPEVSQFLMG